MKHTKTFNYCEYCDKSWLHGSPPPDDQYENGMIEMRDAILFLPKRVAKRRDIHTADVSGYYCNYKCLGKHIKKQLLLK